MNSFLALVHFYPVRDGRGEPPKKVITRKRFAGESIANSLRTDIDYRYSHGSVAKRISTEKVNSRSLGSIIEIRLILLMIFHERRKDFPFYPFLLSSSTLVRFILALSSMNLNRDFIYIYIYVYVCSFCSLWPWSPRGPHISPPWKAMVSIRASRNLSRNRSI